MKQFLIFLFFLPLCSEAQVVFPDSLKDTYVAQMKEGDVITWYKIIIGGRCKGSSVFEKFRLAKRGDRYRLRAYEPVFAYYIGLRNSEMADVVPSSLSYKRMNTYVLSDTSVLALAYAEHFGNRCAYQEMQDGTYLMNFGKQRKGFYDYCENDTLPSAKLFGASIDDVFDLEDFIFPEEYWDDCYEARMRRSEEYRSWKRQGGSADSDSTTQVRFRTSEKVVLVSPNPTTGKVFVNPEASNHGEIYNIYGVKVLDIQLNPTREIDISGLSAGVYFFHLNISNEIQVEKVVKE